MKKITCHPKTLNEAIEMVLSKLDKEDVEYLKLTEPPGLHHVLGMYLRNEMGLWKEGTPFKANIKKRFGLFGHGDDCSGLILTAVCAKLKYPNADVEKLLEQEAAGYEQHWLKSGIDPATGKPLKDSKRKRTITQS
jgi:hypothetical protein